MKTQKLLEDLQEKLKPKSDYELAAILEIRRERISDYKHGKCKPDTYALTRMAIALERDPMELIAEFSQDNEKDEKQREFWKGFIGRPVRAALVVVLLVNCLDIYENAAEAGMFNVKAHYAKYRSLILRLKAGITKYPPRHIFNLGGIFSKGVLQGALQ